MKNETLDTYLLFIQLFCYVVLVSNVWNKSLFLLAFFNFKTLGAVVSSTLYMALNIRKEKKKLDFIIRFCFFTCFLNLFCKLACAARTLCMQCVCRHISAWCRWERDGHKMAAWKALTPFWVRAVEEDPL